MRYWIREVGGWVLVAIGLYFFWQAYDDCRDLATRPPPIVQICALTVCGIFLFRGGIHLLKVSLAARICQQVQDRLYPAPAPGPAAPYANRPDAKPPVARRVNAAPRAPV